MAELSVSGVNRGEILWPIHTPVPLSIVNKDLRANSYTDVGGRYGSLFWL
ncbi:hypothetical protein AB4485_04885 [Vibrio cyclitrophicus]